MIKRSPAVVLCIVLLITIIFPDAVDAQQDPVTDGQIVEFDGENGEVVTFSESEEESGEISLETEEEPEEEESSELLQPYAETEEESSEMSEEVSEEVEEDEENSIPVETSGTEPVLLDEEQKSQISNMAADTVMSWEDYLDNEALRVCLNPEWYIGFTAEFYVDRWTNFYCADIPSADIMEDDSALVNFNVLLDENGESIQVVIADYAVTESVDEETGEKIQQLWFKVEAPEGKTLPQELANKPYVMYFEPDYTFNPPSLLMVPVKAMFAKETVRVMKEMDSASERLELMASQLPVFFEVEPRLYGEWYELSNTEEWNGVIDTEYRYITATSVILIPAEVSHAYDTLMKAEDLDAYYELLEEIPEEIRSQFNEKHLQALENREVKLQALEHIVHTTDVEYGGKTIEVSVEGKIPETGVTLTVNPVTYETLKEEGFGVKNSTDVITALDIKIKNDEDGTEWQPEEGKSIAVSIGMEAFGYEDGRVVKMAHKHGDYIQNYEVMIVLDGKVTVYTGGLSIYLVQNNRDTTHTAQNLVAENNNQNPPTITLTVGDSVIYYIRGNNTNNNNGTWSVTDTTGAIYYTVYSDQRIDNDGIYVPWIEIKALREAVGNDNRVTLRYTYNNGNSYELYYLEIENPKAAQGQKRLYIKDKVNTTGSIIATLVDENGKELSLEGAAFSWTRDDKMFIVPAAYGENYQSVNIARDHGGLVEARVKDNKHTPIKYRVDVILADGTKLWDEYTVYYQSEILNAGFENPDAPSNTYSFFPNGWSELFWKTTAPGTGNNITKDIEYGDVGGSSQNAGTSYGVTQAADAANGGVQFAELNAEEIGTLYQDIITAPGEDINWDFAHAPRNGQDWATTVTNKMFIVIGATEDAQKLTSQSQLQELGEEALKQNINTLAWSEQPVTVQYGGATYQVWYHDAGTYVYNQGYNGKWTNLAGSYTVPDNQYRTRIFFVSETEGASKANAGNLIDKAKAGQYKSYLIEYYEESFATGTKTLTHRSAYDESGEALIYSSVPLKNLDHFLEKENDYLHQILINGSNYPYNIRYSGDESIYIENYPESPDFKDPIQGSGKNYDDYDIVMQIYIRDTVVAVQKELVFPTTMTEEQKLKLMGEIEARGGYEANFTLQARAGENSTYNASDKAVITKRDPAGKYTGYISLGENPPRNTTYTVEETSTTVLPGLVLDQVKIETTMYKYGGGDKLTTTAYNQIILGGDTDALSTSFEINNEKKIAELKVTNTYRERKTYISYKAVGNGKVALVGSTEYVDTPVEELDFYSGEAKGANVHAGSTAKYVGWYLDEACTQPVTEMYGVVDEETGFFKPNANLIETDTITFYAKFDTSSLVINRTNGEPGQTYVYRITGDKLDMYVTVTCDESRTGSCQVSELQPGTYTVEEMDDWSWRYNNDEQYTATVEDKKQITYEFEKNIRSDYWLNGNSKVKKNVQKNAQGVVGDE